MDKFNTSFSVEQRIIHRLFLETPFIPSIGLLTGQMGVSLAFFAHSRHTNNAIYEDFAIELLDDILNLLNNSIDNTFNNGLAGIGWGIEYLLNNGFVVGYGVEICEEIDRKIMEIDPKRITDLSLDYGLEGLLHYVLFHISASIQQNTIIPFDKFYLEDLYTTLVQTRQKTIPDSLRSLSKIYIDFIESGKEICYPFDLTSFKKTNVFSVERLNAYPLGIKDGLAGWLLGRTTNE